METEPTKTSTYEEAYRDHVSTMDTEGSRKWVYPKKPSGKFTGYRNWLSYFLLFFLFITPFLHLIFPGLKHQFMLFNVIERKFHVFGFVFFPQDFYLFALGSVTSLVFIILFTVVYGRIFCGWICPQTIFMEMVFRKIEYAIEGDRNKQMKLDRQPWNAEKIRKKGFKWFVYAILSFLIANLFLCYIIGTETVMQYITDGPSKHISLLIGLSIFTFLFYFVFAWFREQVCTLVCPYGRLQDVLIDQDTIIVAYDYKRGERTNGRSTFRKGQDRIADGLGDCIDCKQCVHVCPTGIDIRNGTQLECVNCTACIDACDEIMTKINLPTGLIRYASAFSINAQAKPRFTIRSKAYSALLTGLLMLLTALLFMRSDYDIKVFKQRYADSYQVKGNSIVNTYEYYIINKTDYNTKLTIKLLEPKGRVDIVNTSESFIVLDPQQEVKGRFNISLNKLRASTSKKITIGIYNDSLQTLLATKELTFDKP